MRRLPRLALDNRRLGGLLGLLVLVLAAWLGLDSKSLNSALSLINTNQPGLYDVTAFVDGDTLEINMDGRTERVRLIGLDTPEKNHPQKPVQCFAQAASQHLEELIGDQPIRLAADPTNQNRDRYDRLLRYVYLPDGTLLNARQIADGFGFAYLAFPFEKLDEFKRLEDEARAGGRGLWSSCRIEQEGGFINTNPAD